MYGLKQASVLAYQNLTKLLTEGGYEHILGSLGMWKHKSRDILLWLCPDDFGVKYKRKEDLERVQVQKKSYPRKNIPTKIIGMTHHFYLTTPSTNFKIGPKNHTPLHTYKNIIHSSIKQKQSLHYLANANAWICTTINKPYSNPCNLVLLLPTNMKQANVSTVGISK